MHDYSSLQETAWNYSERIYLRTVTAYALGLKDSSHKARRISDDAPGFTASVEKSLEVVSNEINRLLKMATDMKKSDNAAAVDGELKNLLR